MLGQKEGAGRMKMPTAGLLLAIGNLHDMTNPATEIPEGRMQ